MSEVSENAAGRRPVAFISHHSSHHEVARHLKRVLDARGVDAWMAPDDVPLRKPFDVAIAEQIPQSDAMILLFSAAADKSTHIRREIMLADDEGVAVLPLRLEAIEPDSLRYLLKTNQWVDWMDRRDEVVDRVVEQISILAGVETPVRRTKTTHLGISKARNRTQPALLAGLAALLFLFVYGLEKDWFASPPAEVAEPVETEVPVTLTEGYDDLIISPDMIAGEPYEGFPIDEFLAFYNREGLNETYFCAPHGIRVRNNTEENLTLIYGREGTHDYLELALSPGERQHLILHSPANWVVRDTEERFYRFFEARDCTADTDSAD